MEVRQQQQRRASDPCSRQRLPGDDYFDPTTGLRPDAEMWSVDNANAPAPTMRIDESVIQPGILAIRTKFDDYTGLFVMHCHRLNHEDNGLMMLVNVIPAVSSYAVAYPGWPGTPRRSKFTTATATGWSPRSAVLRFRRHASVAMGDVDDDGVYDLVVGSGPDHGRSRGLFRQANGRQRTVRDGAGPLPAVRVGRARRHQRRRFADRRLDRRQHHRRLGPGNSQRGQGLPNRAAHDARHRARAVLLVQSLSRRPQRRERRLGLRRFHHRPLQHRHRAGRGQHGAGESVRISR